MKQLIKEYKGVALIYAINLAVWMIAILMGQKMKSEIEIKLDEIINRLEKIEKMLSEIKDEKAKPLSLSSEEITKKLKSDFLNFIGQLFLKVFL